MELERLIEIAATISAVIIPMWFHLANSVAALRAKVEHYDNTAEQLRIAIHDLSRVGGDHSQRLATVEAQIVSLREQVLTTSEHTKLCPRLHHDD